MTLIIGIEDPENDRVIMAADSGAWRGDSKDQLRTSKLWRDGPWLCGSAGRWVHARLGQSRSRGLADLSLSPLPAMRFGAPGAFEAFDDAVQDWAVRLAHALGDLNDALKRCGDDQEGSGGPCILVARERWIWYVNAGVAASTQRGWQVVGASDYGDGAMAAVELIDPPLPPLTKLITAFQACTRCTKYVAKPWHWLDTKGDGGEFA